MLSAEARRPGRTILDSPVCLGVAHALPESGSWVRLPSATAPIGTIPGVPRISSFYGIVIWMYHDEAHHLGRPHFHATYGDDEASVDIESLEIIAGELPPRARRLVVEWAHAHSTSCARTGREPAGTSRLSRSSPSARRSTIDPCAARRS